MPSPIVTATIQATTLASLSNALAQSIQLYQGDKPNGFSPIELLRFSALQIVCAPPNYLWQQWLERTFPAYAPSRPFSSLFSRRSSGTESEKPGVGGRNHSPAINREKEKDLELGDKRPHSPHRRTSPSSVDAGERKLNLRNTMTKWFIDCITLGAVVNTVLFLVLMGIMKGYTTEKIYGMAWSETVPIIVAGYRVWPIASIISFSCVPVEKRIVFLSAVGLAWGVYMSLVGSKL
ncbi:hypothetical protein P152DRAFT_509214 [Eremomyces bilateralis CBS 781.70]|uniref:Uncharacterized protein n=1 Tax=Eremomyces bilateralis CBS 781.70 TaxID=1392243 RepID=A0A6G1FUM0_9PEZI|nr:uncharacterized protein P152DRAFT_509214 [Eremomyces bilateralis CBS 781.70]KAF1809474.1 hypothetical protein P152DRAFT_509214 [Eremomyces bilateralis CBS 781.70]